VAKIAFSDATLRSLPPPTKGQTKYWDSSLAGFGIRISQGGSRTFVLNRDNTLITIGRYPVLSLAKARGEAKRLLAEFTLGRVRPQTISFEQALTSFLDDKRQSRRPRTVDAYDRLLRRFGFKGALAAIGPDEASRKLSKVSSPSERSHMLVAGKVFFNWCRKRRYWEGESPLYGLTKPPSKRRTRTLNEAEVKLFWQATAGGECYDRLLRFQLTTGQRAGELAKLVPSTVTRAEGQHLLTIPDTIAKNRTELVYPLCPFAAELIARRHNYQFLFSDTEKSFSDWSKSKKALDARITKLNGGPIPHWTPHDLRRTYRTLHAKLGTPPHIAERLVHHISSRTDVERIYDQWTFLPEMRAAQQKYEDYLAAVVADRPKLAAVA
jgi:integrase